MPVLRIDRDGTVLRVTLAKPERRNAFDAEVIRELTDAFTDVGEARAVVLAGDGPSFCAGADVEWQRSSVDLTYEENVEDALRLYRMLEAIDGCPAPVVVRAHGYVLGGGSGLVACAEAGTAAPDAVLASRRSSSGSSPRSSRHSYCRASVRRPAASSSRVSVSARTRRCGSGSWTRWPRIRTRPSTGYSPRSPAPVRRPPARRSGSSARGRATRRRRRSRPGCAAEPRARRACARSSRSATRPGGCDTDEASRREPRRDRRARLPHLPG